MTTNDFAAIQSFLGGYFHEDWELNASEPDHVILRFLSSGPSSEEIDKIVAQIDRYLRSGMNEATLERNLLKDLGCYYLPSADAVSTSGWLNHVINVLEKYR